MIRQSPLRDRFVELGAMLEAYGEGGPDLCQALEPIELEYGAIRTGCAIFDEAHRTYIEVRGSDRLEFLNRMLTQELQGIEAGEIRESFWLNRKGRINADLRVMELGERTLLEVDVHAASRTIQTLGEFVFAEDVSIRDMTEDLFKLSLHGPRAIEALARALPMEEGDLQRLGHNRIIESQLGEHPLVLAGDQLTGETSIACIASPIVIGELFNVLVDLDAEERTRRAVGWQALNIARIESGNPMYMLDFGPRSLPAETGLLERRVSFTKGCYLGQEIVARMNSLGHPKKTLVALRLSDPASSDTSKDPPEIPETGAIVRAPDKDKDIGAVTSATLSPMLGQASVAFAMVHWGRHQAGNVLSVQVDDGWMSATVQESLTFWRP